MSYISTVTSSITNIFQILYLIWCVIWNISISCIPFNLNVWISLYEFMMIRRGNPCGRPFTSLVYLLYLKVYISWHNQVWIICLIFIVMYMSIHVSYLGKKNLKKDKSNYNRNMYLDDNIDIHNINYVRNLNLITLTTKDLNTKFLSLYQPQNEGHFQSCYIYQLVHLVLWKYITYLSKCGNVYFSFPVIYIIWLNIFYPINVYIDIGL